MLLFSAVVCPPSVGPFPACFVLIRAIECPISVPQLTSPQRRTLLAFAMAQLTGGGAYLQKQGALMSMQSCSNYYCNRIWAIWYTGRLDPCLSISWCSRLAPPPPPRGSCRHWRPFHRVLSWGSCESDLSLCTFNSYKNSIRSGNSGSPSAIPSLSLEIHVPA